jgi:hypothetical protein
MRIEVEIFFRSVSRDLPETVANLRRQAGDSPVLL